MSLEWLGDLVEQAIGQGSEVEPWIGRDVFWHPGRLQAHRTSGANWVQIAFVTSMLCPVGVSAPVSWSIENGTTLLLRS
jgi:hypothetical protein